MPPTSQPPFERCRRVAARALKFSHGWLGDRDVDTAIQFADLMARGATGLPFDAQDSVTRHSLICDSILCGRWAMSGFPVVSLGHRTAAAFMATRIKPEDAVDFVRTPWPAFGIKLPTPLLTVDDYGVVRDATFMLVTCVDANRLDPGTTEMHRWFYRIYAESPVSAEKAAAMSDVGFLYFNGISLWGFALPTAGMAAEQVETIEGYERWDDRLTTSSDSRTERLARALIVASCLYLSGKPGERGGDFTVKERKSKQRNGDDLPQYREFEIQSAIKINLHHAMRDYVAHGGSTPTVQSLVSGHWKRVAYGVAHANRRLQHILPYWRGDIDAPISTRVK